VDIFYPSVGTVFSKEGVFQHPRLLTAVEKPHCVDSRSEKTDNVPALRSEHTMLRGSAANLAIIARFQRAEGFWTEYHLGLWQDQPLSPSCRANGAIPTGGVPCRPPQCSQPNSNDKSERCSSRRKRMFSPPSCADGAGRTGIGSTFPNGCWTSGASP
jgi:hypothetical protein